MKKYLVFVLAVLMIGALATGAFAGKTGKAGKSNVAHLFLYEKRGTNWDIFSPPGAFGKLKFNKSGSTFDFLLNAHRLVPDMSFSLIYYADPWPGNNPGALIAIGTSNSGGNLHLAGSVNLGIDLPDPADGNYPGGAKIWLIPSQYYDEVDCKVIAWPAPSAAESPDMASGSVAQWLFEHDPITYDDTDAL